MALVSFFENTVGLPHAWAWFLSNAALILIFDVVLLVLIAYLLLFDRKVWAAVQMRRGPNVVGPFGLLQTFADLLKFLFKEVIIPAGANKVIFFLAPLVSVLGIGQIILEGVKGKQWVHVSTRSPEKAINRVITITDAGASYTESSHT